MSLYLSDDVYIVRGKKQDAIYDLKNGSLYSVGKMLTAIIDKLLIPDSEFSESELFWIDIFKKQGILSEQESPARKDIKELCRPHKLKTAWIEIITYCNLKCRHCYEESDNHCTEKMTMEDYRYAVDQLADYGIETVILIGGEPFCHPRLREMLSYASERIKKTAVFTNGTMLNEAWCGFLKEKNITVGISMYSYIPEMHDRVTTVKGSHRRTKKALKLLEQHQIPHKIATVHMKDIDLGEKEEETFVLDPVKDPVRLSGRGNLSLISPKLMNDKLITPWRFSTPIDRDWVIRALNGHQCFSIKIYIEHDLNVRPCVMERRASHGNLRGKTIQEILNNDILYLNKDKIEGCHDCELRYACHDCRADSMSSNIYAKPYVCTYDVENGIWKNPKEYIKEIFRNRL